ncbi:MAG TPA: ribosome assembly RNA-binding protein YhbY [Usitatibacteraceae bacterium]|nr:ribosome assembly RNA-binding protein YhbY [Usitatibacteraceae bacterium]
MKTPLSPNERAVLRARAHPLEPVVLIGDQGITAAVIREIDRSLKAHELIKVRAQASERSERAGMLEQICSALNAAPVQAIGKVFVLWRENPELAKAREQALKPKPVKKTPRLTRQQEEALASRPPQRRPRKV